MSSARAAHGGGSGSALQDWVAGVYYRHGLFCASHPRVVLSVAAACALWACWPLFSVPIYGGEVKVFTETFRDLPKLGTGEVSLEGSNIPYWMENQTETANGDDEVSPARKKPIAYVQQVIVKAMVHPYKRDDLIRTDAFRGPIASAFKLHLEDLIGFYDAEEQLGMDDVCLRTDGLSPQFRATGASASVLPEFGCLVLSPANAWRRDPAAFQADPSILSTVFGLHRGSPSAPAGHSSLAEVLFGMRQRDTGLTRYPIRNRQRVITFAATVALKSDPDPRFHAALRAHLRAQYPLPTMLNDLNDSHPGPQLNFDSEKIFHIFFPSRSYMTELVPFLMTLLALFLYVYFSCRKIELIHSELWVASCAVVTVVSSILMSLGMSGLSLNMDTKLCVVPYLVAFIGLENLMVITRSVVATQSHLDVRIRVAQGLSKEGWNITKTLFAEITCLTVGFFIGILDASIQEFCLLAVMGLLSDFFLQIFVFATALAVDMGNVELRDAVRARRSHHGNILDSRAATLVDGALLNGDAKRRRRKHFGHPISGPGLISSTTMTSAEGHMEETSNVMAPRVKDEGNMESKRVRFMNFWTRRRIIQRLFMCCMIVWLAMMVYQTSLLETIFRQDAPNPMFVVNPSEQEVEHTAQRNKEHEMDDVGNLKEVNISTLLSELDSGSSVLTPTKESSVFLLPKLLHTPEDGDSWKRLPHTHWPALFALYNISVYGGYVSILPPIHVSLAISPDAAKQLRHPQEEFRIREELAVHSVEGLRKALELGEDDDDGDSGHAKTSDEDGREGYAKWSGRYDYSYFLSPSSAELSPFVPTTPFEIFLAVIFVFPSLAFLLYVACVFYSIFCSRNYAEWRSPTLRGFRRASGGGRGQSKRDIYSQIVQESAPILMEGHENEVECLVACESGGLLASLCLQGTVRTWDSYSGELLAHIDRRAPRSTAETAREGNDGGGGGGDDASGFDDRSPLSSSTKDPLAAGRGGGEKRTWSHRRTASLDAPQKLHPPISSTSTLGSGFKVSTNFSSGAVLRRRSHHHHPKSESDFAATADHNFLHHIHGPSASKETPERDAEEGSESFRSSSTVWCMDCCGRHLVLGCADGSLEVWDAWTGTRLSAHDDDTGGGSGGGVTHLRIVSGGAKVVATRLTGHIDFFGIEISGSLGSSTKNNSVDNFFPVSNGAYFVGTSPSSSPNLRPQSSFEDVSSARGHQRSPSNDDLFAQSVVLKWLHRARAHQQPVTSLEWGCGKVLTGSMDHTIKVFRLEDHFNVFTLHGHLGPVTSAFVDHGSNPGSGSAGSGSQDGMVCVWDLLTGACLYSILAHDGAVLSLAHSPSYVISLGADDRVCVWERCQGHLINTLVLSERSMCTDVVMLTHNLLVTSGRDSLLVWDARLPDPVKAIRVGDALNAPQRCVTTMRHLGDAVACNYGRRLRLVHFPLLSDKKE